MESTSAGATVIQDWERLPEDLLITVFCELEIPELIRSGAVCASWHAAYRTFRSLRLPSPKQSPCLLYSCDAYGPDAAALYCPSTGATFHIPVPCGNFRSLSPIGSADGWVVATDEIGNLRLLNPLIGDQAELPPITAMYNVESAYDEEEGGLVYYIDEGGYNLDGVPTRVPAREVLECMYHRAVLSCGPHAGAAAECVVLLIHMSRGELSYARPGDERWTWVPPGSGTGLQWQTWYCDAAYNKSDGLFYVVRGDASVHTLDLTGASPVAKKVLDELPADNWAIPFRYLVHTPCGDLLNVRRYRDYIEPELPPSNDDDDYFDTDNVDPLVELVTTEIQLYRTNFHGQKLERMSSLDDHALFLGYNASLCLPIKDFSGLKPNCAYVTDDSLEFICYFKYNKREVGVWSIESQSLQSLGGATPLEDPWLNWPVPIWITPSLL